MIFPAVFALVVGVGMIGQWAVFLATGQVPELETEPLRIRFHLAAEFGTAIALLVGGIALLTGQSWGRWFYLLAVGMLLYTVIVSPGYFAEKGEWAFVGMFAVVLLLTLVSIVLVV
jgi:peptidoglycan/LPS O-acetylase OafA/YrhL